MNWPAILNMRAARVRPQKRWPKQDCARWPAEKATSFQASEIISAHMGSVLSLAVSSPVSPQASFVPASDLLSPLIHSLQLAQAAFPLVLRHRSPTGNFSHPTGEVPI